MNNPIPERLKAARKTANFTPKELGVKIGIDQSSASGRMNHYEKGRHVPDIGTLTRMAQQLDVPLNYFLCRDELTAALACEINKLTVQEKRNLLAILATNQIEK